jgi:hypothetical protein
MNLTCSQPGMLLRWLFARQLHHQSELLDAERKQPLASPGTSCSKDSHCKTVARKKTVSPIFERGVLF